MSEGSVGKPIGSQNQPLQQGPLADGYPLIVEGLGTHTNPERYVQENKFSSDPVDRAGGVATLLYTALGDITIWWIHYYNHSGGPATVWLEDNAANHLTATTQLADDQTIVLGVKPLDIGNLDVYVNASADDVEAQIGGIETV